MDETVKPLAQFTTNSFAENPYLVISLSFVAGMGMLSVGITAGLPVFACMALLFAGILLVYGYMIGKVQYTLTPHGIQQKIKRFIPYFLFKKEQTRFFAWNQIQSYKNDTDRMRSGKEYEFLKFYLKTSPGEIWITDQHDALGFQQFRDGFISFVKDDNNWSGPLRNENMQETTGKPETGNPAAFQPAYSIAIPAASTQTRHIRERKGFYKTGFAKGLTIFFTLLTLFLIWYFSYKGMHFTNWFRLMFVLLPGTVYMLYRVFFSGQKNNNPNQPYQK